MKYVDDFVKNFSTHKFPVFTKSDAYLFLGQYGVSEGYAKRFLNNMVKGGRIYRIKRDYYTCYSSPYVAGFAFSPFYYGLGTALNMHNLTEQQSQPTVISATKSMPRTLLFRGTRVFVSRISEHMFFGFSTMMFETLEIPVSDFEKTLIDLVYFKYKVDDYVYENIMHGINARKLDEYLSRCNDRLSKSVKKLASRYATKPSHY